MSHLGGANPTLETLSQMERKEFSRKQEDHHPQPQHSRPQENTLVIYNSKETFEPDLGDDILDAYNSTPKAKNKFGKRNEHTPDNRPGQGRSPRAVFSPASFSPTVSTPSSKYKGRTNKGDVVCSFGDEKLFNWLRQQENEIEPVVKQLPFTMDVDTHYMFDKLRGVADVLENAMDVLGNEIASKNAPMEPERVDVPHQAPFMGIGRVCCDSNGRLNSKSLLLESFGGRTVPLDVSQVDTYSLFPGQVVAVRGENPFGVKLIAKDIFSDACLPPPEKPSFLEKESEPLQILVAAGPFTPSDSMAYQPLEDLVDYIREHEPHVVILIGPFVDISHPLIIREMLAESFYACFERMIDSLMEPLKMVKVKVVLVPSSREAHHEMVYPVPPLVIRKWQNKIFCASDPCMLDINGIIIGATSADILFHLGKEELAQVFPGSDRLGRIASHILNQRNFYPLYPPAEEVPLDVKLWGKYAFLPVVPHILILPSDLRCFIKNLNGTVTVNPGRLAKGIVGGNFARLELSNVDGKLKIAAQVVKI